VIRLRRKSKAIFLQNKTGKPDAKSVWIGGANPVVVQSMTTTDTAHADKTLEQIDATKLRRVALLGAALVERLGGAVRLKLADGGQRLAEDGEMQGRGLDRVVVHDKVDRQRLL